MRLPLPTRSISRGHNPGLETNERHSTTEMPMKICYTNSKPNCWRTCHKGVDSSVFVDQSFWMSPKLFFSNQSSSKNF